MPSIAVGVSRVHLVKSLSKMSQPWLQMEMSAVLNSVSVMAAPKTDRAASSAGAVIFCPVAMSWSNPS